MVLRTLFTVVLKYYSNWSCRAVHWMLFMIPVWKYRLQNTSKPLKLLQIYSELSWGMMVAYAHLKFSLPLHRSRLSSWWFSSIFEDNLLNSQFQVVYLNCININLDYFYFIFHLSAAVKPFCCLWSAFSWRKRK